MRAGSESSSAAGVTMEISDVDHHELLSKTDPAADETSRMYQ
jgi:hypothetical protein